MPTDPSCRLSPPTRRGKASTDRSRQGRRHRTNEHSGPAALLFEDEGYALCERSRRADGILVAQTESIHFHPEVVRGCFTTLAHRFRYTDLLWGAIAAYPGAFWTFAIASRALDPHVVRRSADVETRLYDVAAHEWFFIPGPVRGRLLGT